MPAFSLWWREILRFVRDRSRLFGALGQPILFWFLLGGGLGGMFKLPASMGEMSYLVYLYPGILALIILFTAIFSTISIIEDRNSGFLQSVLVAPIPRSSIVLGKIGGGTTLAMIQALLLLVAIPFLGIHISLVNILLLGAALILMAFALTGLGYLIAWRMDSTQGFHSIMNLLLIPMWLLSGAFFPAEGLPAWLSWIMVVNPMTYGVNLIHGILYAGSEPMMASWIITAIFALGTFLGAVVLTRIRQQGD
ncbi:MAG: ABC transporter permease [Candidatus Marinimicrobia bacterium]|nr:ABC transporter permease [Candidatus Neomarinimicrobiota bacterium]MCF7829789.1 ABC transporter permease [Candidatus Neomarinimicrobiota bacterium]MCF7881778.1 ABC transporter permease [Candidatus Neomarinimicrobiota bacterium]